MIRTQISFDEQLYKRAQKLAKQWGVSLAELCRRGLIEVLNHEPHKKAWMAYAGMLEGDESDSASVDAIVYDREAP
jgi:hypothetical protein